MTIRRLTLFTAALLLAGAACVRAQGEGEDQELRQMETRLQEQRAGALCARLILYSDELRKLKAQFTAAGEPASAAAVQTELDAVTLAVTSLTSLARGEGGPPEAGELKPDEKLSSTALAARRIDAIIAKFSPRADESPGERNTPALPLRPRVLRITSAATNPGYSSHKGSNYWSYGSAYAVWTLNDLAPGEYEIQIRYSAGIDSGGKAVVKAAGQRFEVTVPKGGKDSRKELTISAGILTVKEPGVDIRVENGGLAEKAGYLLNLHAVYLVPAAAKRP